jgi:heat shock protein HslJ
MEQESAYLTLLSQATTFTQEGSRLMLYNAKGAQILAFTKTITKEPEPLVGTNWTLESVHTGNAVSSGITGTTITAVFGDDKRISGSAGCNRYTARYNVTSTSLSISGTGVTKMMCDIPGIMNQESAYINLLTTTRIYTIEGDQLALFDESGVRILTFRANT